MTQFFLCVSSALTHAVGAAGKLLNDSDTSKRDPAEDTPAFIYFTFLLTNEAEAPVYF